MQMAEAITLQAGDDNSVTIDISTECVPIELTDYYIFWELKKTLSSDPILSKTTMGTALLPPEITPDIVVDYLTNEITVYINENESADLYGDYKQYIYLRNKLNNKKTSILYGTITFMESPDSEYASVYYTTPEYVAVQMRMTDSDGSTMTFTEDTDPKRSTVIDFIKQAEVRIDRETRNSWKINYEKDEMHDIKMPLTGLPPRDTVVSLRRANILEWDPDKGDSLKVLEYGAWVDYTDEAQEVMGQTWWMDYKVGQVHFDNFWPWFFSGSNRVMISYRWGSVDDPPDDVVEACTKMVCIRLVQSEFNKIMLYNRTSNPINWNQVIQYWEKDIQRVLASRRRKILSVVTR